MVGSYQVEFLLGAVEDLKKLDKLVAQRVVKKVRWLAENFSTLQFPNPCQASSKAHTSSELAIGA
jgi:mRNA-degrading endonuclease RelE of RelBE toxin-antitoxin system